MRSIQSRAPETLLNKQSTENYMKINELLHVVTEQKIYNVNAGKLEKLFNKPIPNVDKATVELWLDDELDVVQIVDAEEPDYIFDIDGTFVYADTHSGKVAAAQKGTTLKEILAELYPKK